MKKKQTLKQEFVPEEALSPDCHVDAADFEWVGQDSEKMQSITRPSISFWKDAFSRIRKDKVAITFLAILAVMVILAIIIPAVYPYKFDMTDDLHKHVGMFFSGDGHFHLFGTDYLGRDMFARIWRGARISLFIAFAAVIINVIIGVIYGGIAGYFGGMVDNILMRIAEIINGIPYLLIVILLMVIMTGGVFTIIVAYSLVGWVGTARLVRGEVMRLKEQEFVVSAKVWVLLLHVLLENI